MSLNLQQTALGSVDPQNDPATIQAALEDTQGNILKSHGRDNSIHLFLAFTGAPAAVLTWLYMMGARHVTSAWQQRIDARAHRETGADGGVFVNLCLSAAGYRALGLTSAMPDDASFLGGAKQSASALNDPPVTQWEPGFQARHPRARDRCGGRRSRHGRPRRRRSRRRWAASPTSSTRRSAGRCGWAATARSPPTAAAPCTSTSASRTA